MSPDKVIQLEKVILDTIGNASSIKGTELIVAVMAIYDKNPDFTFDEYIKTINSLVDRGQVLELEYVSPVAEDRIKSIYFAKGTRFNARLIRVGSDAWKD